MYFNIITDAFRYMGYRVVVRQGTHPSAWVVCRKYKYTRNVIPDCLPIDDKTPYYHLLVKKLVDTLREERLRQKAESLSPKPSVERSVPDNDRTLGSELSSAEPLVSATE